MRLLALHDLAVNLFKDGLGWRAAARIGDPLPCATTVCNTLRHDLQRSETNWCRRDSATRSLVVLPRSENQTWPCAFFPALRSRSRKRSSTSLVVSSRSGYPEKSSGRKLLGSDKSRRRSRTFITTRLSSPTGRLCCSRVSVKVSKRLYCNCQLLPARQSKRRSRSALPSSPNRVLQE